MSFAAQLKKAMEMRNMNQIELSSLTGLSKSSISQYCSGKNIPKDKTIEKMADALECSVAFLNGLDTPQANESSNPKGIHNISVAEAARRIGKCEQYVRKGLQDMRLPFGTAVMMSTKWSYQISPKLLDEYIGENG